MPDGYLQWKAACLICEIEGMKAMNKRREMAGSALAYDEDSFFNVLRRYQAEVEPHLHYGT